MRAGIFFSILCVSNVIRGMDQAPVEKTLLELYPIQKSRSWFFNNSVPVSKQVHNRIVKQALRKRDQFKAQVLQCIYAGYTSLPLVLVPAVTERTKETKKLFNQSLQVDRPELAYLLISHMASSDYDKVQLAVNCSEPRKALLMLVRNKVSLDGTNAAGYTVLSSLARESNKKKVELLLSCGADVNSGTTIVPELYKEKKKNWRDLVGLFLEHGSVIDAESEDDIECNYFFNITHRKGSLFYHAVKQNDDEALKMFLTKALFEPTKKEVEARQKRIIAALCVFKRIGLVRDIRHCILKHLSQDICSSRHCTILHALGNSWQELLPHCTVAMIRNMYLQTPEEHRAALLQEILTVMVLHRKTTIHSMLESSWVLDLYSLNLFFGRLVQKDLKQEVIAALDPLQVEQYDKGIKESLCNVLFAEEKE